MGIFHRIIDEVFTEERCRRPETGIFGQVAGKNQRSQEILHGQDEIMGTSLPLSVFHA